MTEKLRWQATLQTVPCSLASVPACFICDHPVGMGNEGSRPDAGQDMSLPDQMRDQMKTQVGRDSRPMACTLVTQAPQVLRSNPSCSLAWHTQAGGQDQGHRWGQSQGAGAWRCDSGGSDECNGL